MHNSEFNNFVRQALAIIILTVSSINGFALRPIFTKFGEVYPFKDFETQKWGLKINGEICMQAGFDSIAPLSDDLFTYYDHEFPDKEGILSKNDIILPVGRYDKILLRSSKMVIFEQNGGKGLDLLRPVIVYKEYGSGKTIKIETETHPIKPGDYEDIKLIGSPEYPFMVVAQKTKGDLRLICLENGFDYTSFYPLKNLGGNIKKVIEGKLPLDQLKIKKTVYDVSKELRKISEKNNITYGRKPEGFYIIDYESKDKSQVVDTIKVGDFIGTINEIGGISFPSDYYQIDNYGKLHPNNPYVIVKKFDEWDAENWPRSVNTFGMNSDQRFDVYREEANQKVAYYKTILPFWEKLKSYIETIGWDEDPIYQRVKYEVDFSKEKLEETEREAGSYNRTAAFTQAMTNFANSLSQTTRLLQPDVDSNSYDITLSESNDYTQEFSDASSYQNLYDKWAHRAEANYNSITRYSSKNKKGEKMEGHANHSSNPSTYLRQKKAYRTAQSEMKKIRTKAMKKGFAIAQSEYETLPISYD